MQGFRDIGGAGHFNLAGTVRQQTDAELDALLGRLSHVVQGSLLLAVARIAVADQ
jgi:hypothetical protein